MTPIPSAPSGGGAGPSVRLTVPTGLPSSGADAVLKQSPDLTEAGIQEHLDLLVSEEELTRRQGMAEMERVEHTHGHGVRRRIPL